NNEHRDDFGAVRVLQAGGLRIQIRVTEEGSSLPTEFERLLGRPVDVFVGGRSARQLHQDMEAVAEAIRDHVRNGGTHPHVGYSPDFESGYVVVQGGIGGLELPDDVVAR